MPVIDAIRYLTYSDAKGEMLFRLSAALDSSIEELLSDALIIYSIYSIYFIYIPAFSCGAIGELQT